MSRRALSVGTRRPPPRARTEQVLSSASAQDSATRHGHCRSALAHQIAEVLLRNGDCANSWNARRWLPESSQSRSTSPKCGAEFRWIETDAVRIRMPKSGTHSASVADLARTRLDLGYFDWFRGRIRPSSAKFDQEMSSVDQHMLGIDQTSPAFDRYWPEICRPNLAPSPAAAVGGKLGHNIV